MIVLSQGTTPYLSLLIRGYDLSNAGAIMLTIVSASGTLNLNAERITVTADFDGNSSLDVHLTQQETLGIAPGIATIQLRWRDSDGEAYATRQQKVNLLAALYKKVI